MVRLLHDFLQGKDATEERIARALDCPCVADLREGPCGTAFVAAFACFHRSAEVPKGAECMPMNITFAVSSIAVHAMSAPRVSSGVNRDDCRMANRSHSASNSVIPVWLSCKQISCF